MNRCFFRQAEPSDMDSVFKLRYSAYRTAKLIPSNRTKRLQDIYDSPELSAIFVLVQDSDIIGTIRILRDSPIGLPMDDEGFGPAIDPLRGKKRRIVEVGRLAISPEYQRDSRELSLHLSLGAISYSLASNFNDILIMVLGHHHKYYERVLLFETIVTNHKTKYAADTFALRLNLDGLLKRYDNDKVAIRFKIPQLLKIHQYDQDAIQIGNQV